ncbi:hypothetical protein DdX_10426 [Ditylenchus destructor]|uniref:Uncharacterized protein n=1 Tax=Ditylenchus destructor TaxID=166010 RepID=A0AAD4N0B3_9BILA|nr:hypothetical protein DdX_10426 [Ditylenchus destructor]
MLIIFGSESEFNLIRPYLIIKHQCPSIFKEFEKCKFTTKIELPYENPEKDSTRNILVPISGATTEVQCE